MFRLSDRYILYNTYNRKHMVKTKINGKTVIRWSNDIEEVTRVISLLYSIILLFLLEINYFDNVSCDIRIVKISKYKYIKYIPRRMRHGFYKKRFDKRI